MGDEARRDAGTSASPDMSLAIWSTDATTTRGIGMTSPHDSWTDPTRRGLFAVKDDLAERNAHHREMLSQARDLASSHGYTVLQAIQEWYRSKGSSKAMPLGEVIKKFLAAKSNRSEAYTDKLNADLALLESHFGADRPIDRIRSDEIENSLDSKKAAGRRSINLRSEIITLFKYGQNRLRALPRDRKTEAELVEKDQTKRARIIE